MSKQPLNTPELLVSVRSAEELTATLEGGADWIDLKEPSEGPLAAVSRKVAEEAVAQLAGRRPLSAALGELRDWDDSPARELLKVEGIHLVKLGLAGCAASDGWRKQWLAVSQSAAERGKQLVTVVYADWKQVGAPQPLEMLELARDAGSKFLLIDTYSKEGRSTFDYLANAELEEYFHTARSFGMKTVLAGSIRRESVGKIPANSVDIVAVRGAVCRGDRASVIDAPQVAEFRSALSSVAENRSDASCQPA